MANRKGVVKERISVADYWQNSEIIDDHKRKISVEMVVSIVGKERIKLYGKLKGYKRCFARDGRIYGYKDDKYIYDISLSFAIEKYFDMLVLGAADMATMFISI